MKTILKSKLLSKTLLSSLSSLLLCLLLCLSYSSLSFAQSLQADSDGNSDIISLRAQDNQNNDDLAKDASTEINVKNADIAAIVKVFSKKTKRNYILDENVRGKVSIYLPGKVTSDEALRILESVLALKGFTSVPVSKNLWKIIPARDAKGATIPTKLSSDLDSATAAVVTRLINLKYVNAEDMQQIISQMISPNGIVNAYTGTNALIIIDSEDNVARLIDIINTLDVPFTSQEMTIVPIKYAEATDLAEKLKEILTDEKNNATINNLRNPRILGQNRLPQAPQQGGGASASSGKTIASRAKEPKIIADERTNSIILLADDETTARIKALIDQLDSQVDLSGNRYYVYRCQHANAEDLAEVLSGLSSNAKSSSESANPGLQKTSDTQTRNRTQERLATQTRTLGTSRLTPKSSDSLQSATLGEDVSITADASTNSLIISASKADYRKILNLLSELDVKRRQVLVEAMLMEVNLDDTNNMGMEWMTSNGGKDGGFFASNTQGGLNNLFSNPEQLSGFSMAAVSAGNLTIGNINVPTQSVLLQAAAKSSIANVLSAPNILTADNEEAEIVVGQNVPMLASTSTSSDNLNNTFNQIDRQDVGITLRITPRISEGDFVTLKVFTEVSNIIDKDPSLGFTTSVKTSETTVIAKDNQMIVTGGLISDDNTTTENGVPFLKDIPILGHVFKNTVNSVTKKNLLIFITPRIIRDQFDARSSTIEEKEKLEDVIAYNNITPNREGVLNHPRIDEVATSEKYEGAVPSMITAPRDNDSTLLKSSGEILRLKASPKLPSLKLPVQKTSGVNVNSNNNNKNELPKASLNIGKITNKNLSSDNQKYIVMKVLSNGKTSPFKTSKNLFGVTMPSNANANSFFVPGGRYVYNNNGEKIELVAQGVFNNKDKAEYIYEELKLASWNELGSQDLMRSWRKAN